MKNRRQPWDLVAKIVCAVKDFKYFNEKARHRGLMKPFRFFAAFVFLESTTHKLHMGGSHCHHVRLPISVDGYADNFEL